MQQYNIDVPNNLIDNILELKSNFNSKADLRSNVLGWQSPQYTTTKDIPWVNDLLTQCITTADITIPIRHVWFNVNGKDAYHNWHSHGGTSVVGVYYIQVPKDSGNIEFRDGTSIEPYPGLLLIFPAGVEHQVTPNKTNNLRISMAFNINT
jgi:hypothetical protein